MNKIAPYIKASMMMLVHEITEELRNLDPSSYGAGNDCDRENEQFLWDVLNLVKADKNYTSSYQAWHYYPNTLIKIIDSNVWVDVWCYQFYKHSYKFENRMKYNKRPIGKDEMKRSGWENYLGILCGRKLEFCKFPRWVFEAIKCRRKLDSYRVEQICGVYFESFNDNYYRRKGVLDSFLLLKFALNCRAARDVMTRRRAKNLLSIRNMLCHKSPKFWLKKEGAYEKAMRVMMACLEECAPFKNNEELRRYTMGEVERIEKCESVYDICKVKIPVTKPNKGPNVVSTFESENEKITTSFSAAVSENMVRPTTAKEENFAPNARYFGFIPPLHEDKELECSYRRLFML